MPFAIPTRLKKLRAHVKPGGTLLFNHREVVRPAPDDAWWRDVLLDPRARLPDESRIAADSIHARYRLDRQHAEILIVCECRRHKVLDREKMIGLFGADMNVLHLAKEAIDCRERDKVNNYCQATLSR